MEEIYLKELNEELSLQITIEGYMLMIEKHLIDKMKDTYTAKQIAEIINLVFEGLNLARKEMSSTDAIKYFNQKTR